MNKKDNKPVAYLMVGLPGSGKSTWIKEELQTHFPEFEFVLISSDAYIEKKAKEQGKNYDQVFHDHIKDATKEMKNILSTAIQNKQNLVLDQTHMTIKSRKEKIDQLQGYQIVAIVFEIYDSELQKRQDKRLRETGKTVPQHIIDSMKRSYQEVEKSEGIHDIRIYRK